MLALLPIVAATFLGPTSQIASRLHSPARAVVFSSQKSTAEAIDEAVLECAAKVLKASKRFGKPQAAAAQMYIQKALAGEDAVWLTEQKLVLFEQCQLDDESGVCKELDAALTGLEELAAARGGLTPKQTSASAKFDALFKADPVQKAVARVKKAAGAFGPEQKKAADEWIAKTMSREVTDGGASLFSEQVYLFGECVLSEDGTPSKCETLQDALGELREAMGDGAANSFQAGIVKPTKMAEDYGLCKDYGEAPAGYAYDPWGRLVLTKMGK